MTRYTPTIGERVLVVRQSWAHLMNPGHRGHAIGQPEDVFDELPDDKSQFPYWDNFTTDMPGWGYGLMLVRDGKLVLGPENFDTSD